MALLPILSFPDPRLRTIAQPVEEVTDEIRQLAADMFETMYEAPGIGLAATQVDRHIQLIVMDLSEHKDQPLVFINPKVTPLTEETQPYEEGCLSVPQIYDKVERPSRVKIEAINLEGQAFEIEADELRLLLQTHLGQVAHIHVALDFRQAGQRFGERGKRDIKLQELRSAVAVAHDDSNEWVVGCPAALWPADREVSFEHQESPSVATCD